LSPLRGHGLKSKQHLDELEFDINKIENEVEKKK